MNDDKTTKTLNILNAVTDRIKNGNPLVQSRIEDLLVEKEISARVTVLDTLLSKRGELSSELKKIDRPDVIAYNADGTPAAERFSKDRIEAIKKASENIARLDSMVEKAFEGDWSKAKELASKKEPAKSE